MNQIAIVLLAFSVIGTGKAGTNERVSGIQNTIQSAVTSAPQPRKLIWPFYNPYMMSGAYAHMMMNPMMSMMGMNPMMSMMGMNPMMSMMGMNPMMSMMGMNPMMSMMGMNPMMSMMGMNPMMYGMMGMYNPWMSPYGQGRYGGSNNAGKRINRQLFLNTSYDKKIQSSEAAGNNHLTVPTKESHEVLTGPISL